MRGDDDEPVPGALDVALDSGARPGLGRGRPRCPNAGGPIRALRKPAPGRLMLKEPLVLGPSRIELQSDAFISREERKKAMRGRRAHELNATVPFVAA